jgi:hypothetical protein
MPRWATLAAPDLELVEAHGFDDVALFVVGRAVLARGFVVQDGEGVGFVLV